MDSNKLVYLDSIKPEDLDLIKKGLIRDEKCLYRFKEIKEDNESGPGNRYYNLSLIATDENLSDFGEEKKFECRSTFSMGIFNYKEKYRGIYTLSDKDNRSAFEEDFKSIRIEAVDPRDRPLEVKIKIFTLVSAELDQIDLDELDEKI